MFVKFHYPPAIVQTTVSSAKLHLPFSEVDWLHTVWNETHLQSLHLLYAIKKHSYFA